MVVAAPEGEDFLGGMVNDVIVVSGRKAIAKTGVDEMNQISNAQLFKPLAFVIERNRGQRVGG